MSAKLVIGANGFLGSHVLRQLVAADDGSEIRAMVRPKANTIGIDDLDVTRVLGDVFDSEALREAMTGCDVIYHCVVDPRGWLRDPAPLFRTNVEGTRNVLDAAVEVPGLRKFVYTSSYVTVGRRRGKRSTEADVVDVSKVTPYVRSRVQAEDLVLQYARERGLPAVAMCVSTTYGSGDWGRTPHGAIIAGAAFGKLPFVMSGIDLEAVGIDDAATAMLLAADRGTPGERYLISEKMISNAEVARLAAEAAGVASATIHSATRFLRAGRSRHPEGQAARHRRAAVPGIVATDAGRGGARPLQGRARTRLAAKAGRGIHRRGGKVLGGSARGQTRTEGQLNTTPRSVKALGGKRIAA